MSSDPFAFNPYAYRVEPKLDIRRLSPEFESLQTAQAECNARIKSLVRAGFHEQAKQLSTCRKGQRCLSAACPKCLRRYRIWLIAQILRIFQGGDPLSFVTLIPAKAAFASNKISKYLPGEPIKAFQQQLRRAGVDGPVIGGLDGEYDADRKVYQPHFHLICLASQVDAIRELACRHYPNTDEVCTGCRVEKVTDLPKLAGYLAKGYWPKRIRWGKARKRKKQRLDEPMHAEWLVWRDHYRLNSCLILIGIHRYGGELQVIGCNRGLAKKTGVDSAGRFDRGRRGVGEVNCRFQGNGGEGTLRNRARPEKVVSGALSRREVEEALRFDTINGRKLTRKQQRALKSQSTDIGL